MNTFVKRTLSGAVYAALFIGSIYSGRLLGNSLLGCVIFTVFLLFVAIGGTFEFFRMVAQQGAKPCRVLGYALVAMLLPCLAFDFKLGAAIVFIVGFALAVMVQLWQESDQPFRDAAYTILPMLYIAMPLGFMPMLHERYNVLMMCIIMVWVNDSFAYIGGSLCGKHKMWQRHSPGKTWEGTIIGAAVCLLVGVFVGPKFALKWADWLVLGVICSVVGTLGDLVESMFKRSVGVKDSGKIMPGHGGFLDRFDSLLMIVPFVVVYCIITNYIH